MIETIPLTTLIKIHPQGQLLNLILTHSKMPINIKTDPIPQKKLIAEPTFQTNYPNRDSITQNKLEENLRSLKLKLTQLKRSNAEDLQIKSIRKEISKTKNQIKLNQNKKGS